MKKIFIGCGIIGLILLGLLGYFGYQLYPVVKQAMEVAEVMGTDLVILEEDFPFDASQVERLDRERFTAALEIRRELVSSLRRLEIDLNTFGEGIDEEDKGFFNWAELFGGALDQIYPLVKEIPGTLRSRQMSASEVAWHSRVMWATLKLIDAGAADESMQPLRGEFDRFRGGYREMQRQQDNDLPPLDELIGEFDTTLLLEAKNVFAMDPQRVLDGITEPTAEVLFLSFSAKDLQEDMDEDDTATLKFRVNDRTIIGVDPDSENDSGDVAPPEDG